MVAMDVGCSGVTGSNTSLVVATTLVWCVTCRPEGVVSSIPGPPLRGLLLIALVGPGSNISEALHTFVVQTFIKLRPQT